MPAAAKLYGNFAKTAMNAALANLDGNVLVKVSLHTASYTPNQDTHVFYSDLTNELSDPSYTAGGKALTGVAVTQAAKVVKIDADDITFTNLSGTFRYAVVRDATSGVAATEPLIGYFDLTGANITPAAQDYKITWNAAGLATQTAA